MERFERVATPLGEKKRQEVIDGLDNWRSVKYGDEWQVFKEKWQPGFWSPPDEEDMSPHKAP